MQQEMILRDLLAQNRGLRLNGDNVLHQKTEQRHCFTFCEQRPGGFGGTVGSYIGFNPDQTVQLSDENNATVHVYDSQGGVSTAQLTFRPQPWTISQMFNGIVGGPKRTISEASMAWRLIISELHIEPVRLQELFTRYCDLTTPNNSEKHAALLRQLTSDDMTGTDLLIGLRVVALNFYNKPLPSDTPRVLSTESWVGPLSVALLGADSFTLDSVPAKYQKRSDGKLVFVAGYSQDDMAICEFDPHLQVEMSFGSIWLADVQGQSHYINMFRTRAVTRHDIQMASSQLAGAVSGNTTKDSSHE